MQQSHNYVPASITFGRVVLLVSCGLFFIDAFLELVEFSFASVSAAYPNFLYGAYTVDWSDAISVFDYASLPIIATFMVFAAIGGVSYVLDKGPFVSWVSLAAIVSALIVFVRILFLIGMAFTGNLDYDLSDPTGWLKIVNDFEINTVLYFIGWMFAKNWLD